ncbi:GNAT family N-acetyltransferase [Mixta theicola]|uniref:GNAT family N-acetyltransferase n=1 Tax=Mixta theicola TaxID=1458355 RepID=A0A2K1QF08_9GAMM|nr:GNAT family N-acetyltransferase [Mixta theicola]PNS13622.1 GNAT family N-acetyltransferase [Mixta theicola]GLR09951.1 acetyltransferase GCN5 [Mixta theicola]
MSKRAEPLLIRAAGAADIAAIAEIYAWHVQYGCASFEETPPDEAEMHARLLKVQALEMPYLVAEQAGRIMGFSYASPYRPRPAYRYSVEESIYLAHDVAGRGIGSALLAALIARCEQGPWQQMLAVIGNGEQNIGSLKLHLRLGFRQVGILKEIGFKHGAWRDTLIMQRALSSAARAAEE